MRFIKIPKEEKILDKKVERKAKLIFKRAHRIEKIRQMRKVKRWFKNCIN